MKAFVYGGPGPKALEDRPKPKATIATETLDNINDIFARMHHGDIQGRIVIDFQGKLHGHATARRSSDGVRSRRAEIGPAIESLIRDFTLD